MLSRVLYGAQLSVIIGLCAAALATVISVVIGVISGYVGGRFDMLVQRFVDAWHDVSRPRDPDRRRSRCSVPACRR